MKFFDEVLGDVSPDDGRSISRSVTSSNILVHDEIIYCFMNTEQINKNIFANKNKVYL